MREDCTKDSRNVGFSLGPKLPALVRTLRLQRMYITNHNPIEIKVPLQSFIGKAETRALVNSGATENFIDFCTITKLRLGTRKLPNPRMVYNVDQSINQNGTITHCCDLYVTKGNQKTWQQFYVMNLGWNELIFGYPWLKEFNPQIDWKEGQILRPVTKLKTIMKNQLQLQAARIIPHLKEGDELHYQIHRIEETSIRKIITATEMAIKAWDPTKENMEKTIPLQYQDFTKIFSEEEAKHFPPSRPWDYWI